jgi:hypothetical protein
MAAMSTMRVRVPRRMRVRSLMKAPAKTAACAAVFF